MIVLQKRVCGLVGLLKKALVAHGQVVPSDGFF